MPGEILPEKEIERHLFQTAPSETPANPDSPLISHDVLMTDQETGKQ